MGSGGFGIKGLCDLVFVGLGQLWVWRCWDLGVWVFGFGFGVWVLGL